MLLKLNPNIIRSRDYENHRIGNYVAKTLRKGFERLIGAKVNNDYILCLAQANLQNLIHQGIIENYYTTMEDGIISAKIQPPMSIDYITLSLQVNNE